VFPFYPVWLSNTQLLYTADGKLRTTTTDTNATVEIPFEARFTLQRPDDGHKSYDFDSTASQQVKGIVSPALSPDAQHVLFEANNQLWILDVGTPKPRQLTNDGYLKVDPTWSRDGTKIVYSSDRAGTEDIYIQPAAGGAATRITSGAGAEIASTTIDASALVTIAPPRFSSSLSLNQPGRCLVEKRCRVCAIAHHQLRRILAGVAVLVESGPNRLRRGNPCRPRRSG